MIKIITFSYNTEFELDSYSLALVIKVDYSSFLSDLEDNLIHWGKKLITSPGSQQNKISGGFAVCLFTFFLSRKCFTAFKFCQLISRKVTFNILFFTDCLIYLIVLFNIKTLLRYWLLIYKV